MILSFFLIFIFLFYLRFYFPLFDLILKLYVGILIIGLVLFSRFRERVDHALTFEFFYIYYFFSLFMLVIYLISLNSLYTKELDEENSLNNNSKFSKIKNFFKYILNEILEIRNKSLIYVTNLFFSEFVKNFCNLYMDNLYNYVLYPYSRYYKFIYFFIFLFPRILLSTAFFIDVIIFHYMCYLYKILWIIWIPLLFRIIFYLLIHWHKYFLNHFLEVYTVLKSGDIPGTNQRYRIFDLKDSSKQKYSHERYSILEATCFCIHSLNFALNYAKKNVLLIKIFETLVLLIYITTWVYIFFQLSISLLILYYFIII